MVKIDKEVKSLNPEEDTHLINKIIDKIIDNIINKIIVKTKYKACLEN
jgi:hypothetical protein